MAGGHNRFTGSPEVVEAMLGDLRTPLYGEDLKAQRRVLGSFVRRIEVLRERGRTTYTFPLDAVPPCQCPRRNSNPRFHLERVAS